MKKDNAKTTRIASEHNELTNTRRVDPITLCNKFIALQFESDDEADDEETDKIDEHEHNNNTHTTRRRHDTTSTDGNDGSGS